MNADPAAEAFFGHSGPEFEVEAPGRVNLVGDHIDYLGYDVLPVALSQHISIAARRRDDSVVRVCSSAHDEIASFRAGPLVPTGPAGHWSNYVRAAVQELHCDSWGAGFDAVVSSTLPSAAGLSSSSALVVASGLAFLAVNDDSLPPLELAERMARAERYVGTQGGGMDQAACLLSQAGAAARISFSPLRVAHIPIPAGWQFVVANSLERAEKSGAAQRIYNARSRDAREAHETVNRSIVASPHEASAADRLVRGRRLLSRESFTRFRHVTTEAERVEQAARALLADDPIDFGRSMNASHDSLRDDFEVSTPALDSLCAILRAAGAVGARLTGAGLGGSVVALSSAADATLLIEALDRLYYRPAGVEPSDEVRFLVEPSAGAHVRFT